MATGWSASGRASRRLTFSFVSVSELASPQRTVSVPGASFFGCDDGVDGVVGVVGVVGKDGLTPPPDTGVTDPPVPLPLDRPVVPVPVVIVSFEPVWVVIVPV